MQVAYLEAETASVVIRKHDVSKKRRADFDNEIRIRKWLGKLAVGNRARSINKRNEILLRIKFYRSHNLPFLSFYWALRYFASFPPTSWTEGKIFLGELLFPSVYLRTKKMIGG
jgi:hypothetical protein